ncbi:MAG: InlB B-repeat-containing protein [Clostridia bacterium]|nr:InlB B-repeat-containing protein [Clostridia bacterium]
MQSRCCSCWLTLVAMLGTVIQAAPSDYYVLKIDYDAERCNVTVLLDDKDVPSISSEGNTREYHINYPFGKLYVKVEPEGGYQVSLSTDQGTDSGLPPFAIEGDVRTYKLAMIEDMHCYVNCTPKTYTVVELAATPGADYDSAFGEMTYEYGSKEEIFLPNPTLPFYKFCGWDITDMNGNMVAQLGNGIDTGKVVFPTNIFPKVGNTLYAYPRWEGLDQTVTRYDREYGTEDPVNYFHNPDLETTTVWKEKTGTEDVTGLGGNKIDADRNAALDSGGYKMYVGYYPFADYEDPTPYYTLLPNVSGNEAANLVVRYYTPITYEVSYEGFEADDRYPTSHCYNEVHSLKELKPERVGYTFAGFKVYIMQNGEKIDVTGSLRNNPDSHATVENLTLEKHEFCLADGNTDEKIVIEATWTPNTYDVVLDYNHSDLPTEMLENAYNYETGVTLPNPERTGYEFVGWELPDGTVLTPTPDAGTTVIPAMTFVDTINLVATWTPKTFTVTLDGNGADSTDHTASLGVTFDAALILPDDFKLPMRIGHTFVGYYLTDADGKTFFITVTENGDGTLSAKSEITQWKIDGDTTLVAEWSVNSYLVEVDVDLENAEFVISDEDGNGRYDYNEWITVTVTALNNHKLVQWCGTAIEHQTSFTWRFQLGAQDTLLTGIVLPMITVPAFEVDYLKEVITADFSTIPDGRYQIVCEGEEPLTLVVRNGKVSVNGGNAQDVFKIPETFYGKTIQILTCGVPEISADSDWYSLTVNPRPAMPEANKPSAEIGSVYQQDDTKMVITMTDLNQLDRFEFACSENGDGTDLTWWNVQNLDERHFVLAKDKEGNVIGVMFVNLKPGTFYHVYVRVKAAENEHAHGVSNRFEKETYSDSTLDAKKNALLQLIRDDDGEMVRILIEQAIKDADSLVSPSPTFYSELEAIYARVLAGIEFARVQDAKIAELKALQAKLIASGEFSNNNVNLINNICEVAVQTIKSATAIDAVLVAYESGMLQMKAVPVTNLICGDMELIAKDGLDQGTVLSQDRLMNIDDVMNAVNTAIQTGKFVYGGTAMTQAQVAEALKSLDVMAAYQMRLTDAANVTLTPNGSFEIRLLLPENLRNISGLQVAFYNEKTGEIEVLDTVKDGNCLIFYATHTGDFVLLGDPTMNLTGFIIAFGLILACQLVGVILLLVRRAKYAKNVRRYSAILPTVMLTIRFLPSNGVTILAILGALVVIFQIILIYLLLSSEVVYRQKRRATIEEQTTPAEDVEIPVVAQVEDADEEAYAEEAYEDDYEADRASEEEAYGDEAAKVFAAVNEASYEDDFIEPAANPRYSLPAEDAFDIFAKNEDVALEEDSDSEVDENAATWEYGDEETENLNEEESEWSEENARWQYDDELTEDEEIDAEQAFETESYDTETYAETEYEEGEEVFVDEDGYVALEDVDAALLEVETPEDGEEIFEDEIFEDEALENEVYEDADESEALSEEDAEELFYAPPTTKDEE